MTYCYIRTSTGNFDDAVTHLKEAAQIGSDLNLEEARLFGLTHTANTLAFMTRFEDAWQAAGEARRVAEEAGNRRYLAELLTFTIPSYHLRNGDLEEAGRAAEEGVGIAAQIGAADHESTGAYMLGQLAEMRGEYERAVMRYERALEAGRTAGMPYLEASALCGLGTAYLGIGDEFLSKATDLHAQALKMMEMPLGAAMGAMNWVEIGFCALAAGNIAGAGEFFLKGLTAPTAPMYLERPRLLVGAAFVALSKGNLDDAVRFVREARDFVEAREMKYYYPLTDFADARVIAARDEMEGALRRFARAEGLALGMKMRPLLWQARAGAARVLSAMGRRSEAEEKRRQAREVIDEIAGLFQDEKLRTIYLGSATKKLA
jgi:tetratricopeptide (TPR) repeat protein